MVLPAYNEEEALGPEIDKIRKVLDEAKIQYEIIVVNDGSTDRTAEVAKSKNVRIVSHKKNRGNGAARKSGLLSATYDLVLNTDADGTYPAEQIPDMIRIMEEENSDMVVGARIKESGTVSWIRLPAKLFIRKLASYLSKVKIPDLNSGLRIYRKSEVLKYFHMLPDSHSWVSTIILAFLCNNHRVDFVPVDYFPRSGGKSSFHPIKDTYNYLSLVIRTVMYFNPLRIFLPLTAMVFFIGSVKIIYDWIFYRFIGGVDVTLMLSGLLILVAGLLADLIVTVHRKTDAPMKFWDIK